MGDRIKVRITASQTIRYSQVREMSSDDYAIYLEMCDNDDVDERELVATFEWMVDQNDMSDSDEIEDLEITPVKESEEAGA